MREREREMYIFELACFARVLHSFLVALYFMCIYLAKVIFDRSLVKKIISL